jgi:hypothetical protein
MVIVLLICYPLQRLALSPSSSLYMRAWVLTFSTLRRRGLLRTSPLRCPPTYSVRVNTIPCRGSFSHGLTDCQIGAIAWRIFNAGKPLGVATTRMLWPVIFIIVESSALYAIGIVAVLAFFLSGSNAQYPAVDAVVPLVVRRTPHILSCTHCTHAGISQGIVFSLIVLQIRFHVGSSAIHRSGDGQMSTGGTWHRTPGPGQHAGLNDPEYPMRSIRMAVHVSRQTHTHLSTQDASRVSSSDDGIEKSTAL